MPGSGGRLHYLCFQRGMHSITTHPQLSSLSQFHNQSNNLTFTLRHCLLPLRYLQIPRIMQRLCRRRTERAPKQRLGWHSSSNSSSRFQLQPRAPISQAAVNTQSLNQRQRPLEQALKKPRILTKFILNQLIRLYPTRSVRLCLHRLPLLTRQQCRRLTNTIQANIISRLHMHSSPLP